jgi:hypothetical protein
MLIRLSSKIAAKLLEGTYLILPGYLPINFMTSKIREEYLHYPVNYFTATVNG